MIFNMEGYNQCHFHYCMFKKSIKNESEYMYHVCRTICYILCVKLNEFILLQCTYNNVTNFCGCMGV